MLRYKTTSNMQAIYFKRKWKKKIHLFELFIYLFLTWK